VRTYVLDFAEDWAPTAVDEREVEQFYAATAPPGGPPLEDVREHVIAALVRTKQSVLTAPTPAIDLHLLYTLDDFVELHRGGPKELADGRYWTATEAVEHLASLRPIIEAQHAAVVPEDLKARAVEQLFAACDAIASVGAPVRLIEAAFELSLDDQVAVLASAGIALRPGTTREELASNYTEAEIAARPWECLFDFSEHSDHLIDLALKRIETEDDRDAYASLVKTFARLARGQFPAENVSGDVDLEARTGFVEFTLDGKRHRIAAGWNGEWLDMDVLAQLDRLLGERAYAWGFYGLRGGGEGMMTLATDRAGYLRLRAAGAPVYSLHGAAT
jgi:hypothetical protein